MKMISRRIIQSGFFLFLFVIVVAFFFPKRLYIHYDNPGKAIEIELKNYDQSTNQIVIDHNMGMMVIKRPLVETVFSKDLLAVIQWSYIGHQEWIDRMNIIGDSGKPYLPDVCRLDVYLNQEAQFVRYETTDFLFLNFCF